MWEAQRGPEPQPPLKPQGSDAFLTALVCRGPRGWKPRDSPVQLAVTDPPLSSPKNFALVPEGVEPVIAGLGTLRGDGQQVGGAAAGLDAACKTAPIGPHGQWGCRSGASCVGRARRSWSQSEEVRHQVAGPAETVGTRQQGGGWGWGVGSTHCSPWSNGGPGQR